MKVFQSHLFLGVIGFLNNLQIALQAGFLKPLKHMSVHDLAILGSGFTS